MSGLWASRDWTQRHYAASERRSSNAWSQCARRQHGTCVSANASGN
jgi:hypothetical protein